MTFRELAERYLSYQRASLRPSSFETLESRFRVHILPLLGDEALPLSHEAAVRFKQGLQDRGLSNGYKRTLYTCAVCTLNFSNEHFGTAYRLPGRNFRRVLRRAYTIWDPEDYGRFRALLSDPLELAFFDTLYFSGARRGEVLALKPESLLKGGRIAIRESYTRRRETETKTPEGVRTVTLPGFVFRELEALAGKTPRGRRLFERMSYTTIKRRLDTLAMEAGLERPRVHDFRHSHITVLLYEGFTPRGIAERVGHGDTATLFEVYSGYRREEDDKMAERLERLGKRKIPGRPGD